MAIAMLDIEPRAGIGAGWQTGSRGTGHVNRSVEVDHAAAVFVVAELVEQVLYLVYRVVER